MATPSSKHNPGATPTQITSSPYPSAPTSIARPLSHKSPLIRTPSASGHGQSQHPQTASFQGATPLAASASEDPVAFSSPSALIALTGFTGITPSPAGQEGLVGQAIHESDLHSIGMSGLGLGPRDNDEERKRRIEQVAELLRKRVVGRGVCREAVERLGRLEGFECLWQDNNLNIAGNSVDLEIEFHDGEETVKDVSLGYATAEAMEGERREEATAVLKRNLIQSAEEREQGRWKRLDEFHGNLERLALLDQLSREVNCFEAVEGLYESLKRIWEEETKRPKQEGIYEHLCKGWIGRPGLHKRQRAGLGIEYWVEQRRLLDSRNKQPPNAMSLDDTHNEDERQEIGTKTRAWNATIECEEGYPSIRVSKDWVATDVLTTVDANGSSAGAGAGSGITLVNWVDPPPTFVSSMNQSNPGSMAIDSAIMDSATPNRRFVAKLDPPVDVPIIAASEIYRHLGMQLPQEFKLNTFDGLLVPHRTVNPGHEIDELQLSEARMVERDIFTFDALGKHAKRRHIFNFNAFEQVAGRTIRELPFAHPRQLADVFPILRQYALLSHLLTKLFSTTNNGSENGSKAADGTDSEQSKSPATSRSTEKRKAGTGTIMYRSNNSPMVNKLAIFLRADEDSGTASSTSTLAAAETKVEISLRTPVQAAPSIFLFFVNAGKPVTMTVEVGLNGRITISSTTGFLDDVNRTGAEGQGAQGGPTPAMQALHSKLAEVLETCEDLGLMVEWAARWIDRHAKDSSIGAGGGSGS